MSPGIFKSCLNVSLRTLRILRIQAAKLIGKCYILDLPLEILEHIFTYLPIPSKACLALSCKRLHESFSSVLEAKALRFPLLFQKKAYLTTEEYHQRMTLLIQLENWRWLCCAQCQKLHPRKEFSGLREEYLLGLEPSSPWDRKCSTWAGILDLCPCIAMTLRDRKHIVEHLSGTRDRHKPIMNFMRKGLLRDSLNDKGERCLSHTCPAYKSVQLEITLSIAESGLISCAKYEASPSASRSTLKSIDVCCRRSQRLSEHLDDSATYTCGCYARISPLPRPAASSGSRAVEVTRFLGKGAWLADSKSKTKNGRYEVQWWRQCRREKSYIPS